tara:strand:- start:613 stop:1020 length:408 start_codon:yes stop_codon:yes gene_type:complete
MSYASYKTLGQVVQQPGTQLPELPQITSQEHRNHYIQEYRVLVIDNYTEWCGPCKQIDPQIRELAQQYPGQIYFVRENVDDEIEGAPQITGVPCFHFYAEGKYISELTITGGDVEAVKNTCNQIVTKINNFSSPK